MMMLRIEVYADGTTFRGGASITVCEPYVNAFKPMRTCDDEFIRYVTGESCDAEAVVIRELRKDYASVLANALTSLLLEAMGENDTHNGYKTEKKGA